MRSMPMPCPRRASYSCSADDGTPAERATLDAPVEGGVGILGGAGRVLVVGVHPQLAPGGIDDRPRQAVVVGVRVRADDQAHVLELESRLVERPARVRQARRDRHAGVEQDYPLPAATRPRVAVRDPGQGSGRRNRQTPGSTRSARASSRLRAGWSPPPCWQGGAGGVCNGG
jgi:hypothetical protein